MTLDDYLGLQHVMVSSRRRGRGLVDIALARIGRQADTALRVMHFQSALHVVMGSDMAVAAPLSLASRYEVVRKELPFDVPPLRTVLYWHRNADHDPANIWMRKLIIGASSGKVADPGGRCASTASRCAGTAGKTGANDHCEAAAARLHPARGPALEFTMRPEIERLVEEIKQSVGLLRRHL